MGADLAAIVDALDGKKEGNSYRCACPVHNGHSLIVSERDGTLLVHCHGGCEQDDVLIALRERGLWSTGSSPSTNGATPPKGDKVPEAEYEYRNDKLLVAVKGRFRTPGGKTFWWCLPDSTDWDGLHGLKEADLPLYNTHLLGQHDGPAVQADVFGGHFGVSGYTTPEQADMLADALKSYAFPVATTARTPYSRSMIVGWERTPPIALTPPSRHVSLLLTLKCILSKEERWSRPNT